jgi:hypothetical protein
VRSLIVWNSRRNSEDSEVSPDTLNEVLLMEQDSKRFGKTGGWNYAPFSYNAKIDAYAPLGSGSECGNACHTIIDTKDYIFTTYES